MTHIAMTSFSLKWSKLLAGIELLKLLLTVQAHIFKWNLIGETEILRFYAAVALAL